MNVPKISVIIPVYNAENYIERCVRSLFAQTMEDIEYIFVNDCSPDGSIEVINNVLNDFPSRRKSVVFIENEHNQGVGTSRQRGLVASQGEYVIHADPDDWLDRTAYEILYNAAMADNLDMVVCDYIIEYRNHSQIEIQKLDCVSHQALLSMIAEGKIHGGLWNKLIKREYINKYNIHFQAGLNICEDQTFCFQLLLHEMKLGYIKKPLYHYDKYSNVSSLTKIHTHHHKEQVYLWQSTLDRVFTNNCDKNYNTACTYLAYWSFTHALLKDQKIRHFFRPFISRYIKSNRKIRVKLPVILSLFGLHSILYWGYLKIQSLK